MDYPYAVDDTFLNAGASIPFQYHHDRRGQPTGSATCPKATDKLTSSLPSVDQFAGVDFSQRASIADLKVLKEIPDHAVKEAFAEILGAPIAVSLCPGVKGLGVPSEFGRCERGVFAVGAVSRRSRRGRPSRCRPAGAPSGRP